MSDNTAPTVVSDMTPESNALNIPWTQFWDMHSGGGLKEKPYHYIYIQAPEEEAKVIFYNRFGHDSDRVSCTCCGEDYVVREFPSLHEATAYHRGLEHDAATEKYIEPTESRGRSPQTLEDHLKEPDVLAIYDRDIKPDERQGERRRQGYVWVD
jgi:hypothetical protein